MSLCSNTFRMQWLLLICFYHVTLLLLRNLLLSNQMAGYSRGTWSSANAENAIHTPRRVARDGIAYSIQQFASHYGPGFRRYWDEAACSATGEDSSASSDQQGCSIRHIKEQCSERDVKEAVYQFANHEGALPAEKEATVVASSLVQKSTAEERHAAAIRDEKDLYSEVCSWTKPPVPETDNDAILVWGEWDKYKDPSTGEYWWYNRETHEFTYYPPWNLTRRAPFRYQ